MPEEKQCSSGKGTVSQRLSFRFSYLVHVYLCYVLNFLNKYCLNSESWLFLLFVDFLPYSFPWCQL